MANDLLDVSSVVKSFNAVSTSAMNMIPENPISAITTGVSNLGTGALTVWNNHTLGKIAIPLAGVNLVGAGVAAAGGVVSTALHDWHERKMQAMNFKHQERLQKEENKHNEAVLKEQHRHEEYIISEQRKVLEKILEVTLTAYAKKLDFLQAQMNCISETYQQELKLINENISFLEHEKIEIKDNMDLYMEFSRDVRECYKSKDELTKAYNEANRNITTAMQCVKLEESFDSKLQQTAAQLQQITNRGGK